MSIFGFILIAAMFILGCIFLIGGKTRIEKLVAIVTIGIASLLVYLSNEISLYFVSHWSVSIAIGIFGLFALVFSDNWNWRIKGALICAVGFAVWSLSSEAEEDYDRYCKKHTDSYLNNTSDRSQQYDDDNEDYNYDENDTKHSSDIYIEDNNYPQYNTTNYYSTPQQNRVNRKACRACRNTGNCIPCNGSGQTRTKVQYHSDWSKELVDERCNTCGGSGSCRACGGDGWLDEGIDY